MLIVIERRLLSACTTVAVDSSPPSRVEDGVVGGELLGPTRFEAFEDGVDRRIAGVLLSRVVGVEDGRCPVPHAASASAAQRVSTTAKRRTGGSDVAGGGHGAVRLRRYRGST